MAPRGVEAPTGITNGSRPAWRVSSSTAVIAATRSSRQTARRGRRPQLVQREIARGPLRRGAIEHQNHTPPKHGAGRGGRARMVRLNGPAGDDRVRTATRDLTGNHLQLVMVAATAKRQQVVALDEYCGASAPCPGPPRAAGAGRAMWGAAPASLPAGTSEWPEPLPSVRPCYVIATRRRTAGPRRR